LVSFPLDSASIAAGGLTSERSIFVGHTKRKTEAANLEKTDAADFSRRYVKHDLALS
jgi:hypothetical protein